MMNILVTGADGQLGSALRQESVNSDCVWVFTSDRSEDARLDITDKAAVLESVRNNDIGIIINCAAYTCVDRAEGEPEAARHANAEGPAVLAAVAAETGAVLIHVSTDYVFDGKSSVPYLETDPVNPLNVYGHSKAEGEKAIISSGCRHMIFRTSWLYYHKGVNFVRKMLELTSSRPVVKVVCDQVGSPTYAGDLAAFMVMLVDGGMLRDSGIWHYSNEGVCSWYDFAKEITSLSGYLCDVMPCSTSEYRTAAERPMYSVLDKSKVKADFNVEIPYWKDSLSVCFDEILEEES